MGKIRNFLTFDLGESGRMRDEPQDGYVLRKQSAKLISPKEPFKRKLTPEEKRKMNYFFKFHSYSAVDADNRIILGGGEEARGMYWITPEDLEKLNIPKRGGFGL